MPLQPAFSLEALAHTSRNYLEQMVDADGLPYFNVFYCEPSMAAHDWPDFGDVMGRQYQGAVMLRCMTGETAATEDVWRHKLLGLLSPVDGLLYRPLTNYSTHVADPGDQCLTLFALATAHLANPSDELERAVARMVRGLEGRSDEYVKGQVGFMIKSLTATARAVPASGAMTLAGRLVASVVQNPGIFPPDGAYPVRTHVHGTLRTLVGVASYARATGDTALVERVYQLYRVFRAQGTPFGFLPEAIARPGDIVTCETCALMDYAGLGVELANAGYDECWADMERLARNQLAESQVRDLAWLPTDETLADTAQFLWRGLRQRLIGAWAGWTSPTHLLGAEETLNAHWGGPELRDRTRFLQNCCGGSGVHALYILWKNATRYDDGRLSVNMHLDRNLPEAVVLSDQPYRGHLDIRLKRAAAVRIRLPDWLGKDSDLRLARDGAPLDWKREGLYLEVGQQPAGSALTLDYPLSMRDEEVAVGNPGFRQYSYRVAWKGDTVTQIEPLGEQVTMAYSDFDKKQVRVYFGEEGPGRLYLRDHLLSNQPPAHSTPWEDRTPALDLW